MALHIILRFSSWAEFMRLFHAIKPLVLLSSFVGVASAHTFVWSVWVNGVDQGTGNGIRHPAYNGPYPAVVGIGYASDPVRDLNSIDMRCNVLGDIQNPATIKVAPGDTFTFEWHHDNRTSGDDVIDGSHKGAGLVYISPDPPTDSSWVKIQEEGEGPEKGTWYVTGKHTERHGKQDVVIPDGLAPGYYLLRSELLALHQAETAYSADANEGTQIYIGCVQVEVTGSGTTQLPAGVGFPGAYSYSDPGIVYNLYYQPDGSPLYPIPGPPVWSGAAPSPDAPAYGSINGLTTAIPWSTWIGAGFSSATLATSLTINLGSTTITTAYIPSWSSVYNTPTAVTPVITAPPESK